MDLSCSAFVSALSRGSPAKDKGIRHATHGRRVMLSRMSVHKNWEGVRSGGSACKGVLLANLVLQRARHALHRRAVIAGW